MNPVVTERRKHKRIALRLVVEFRGAAGSAEESCYTENISSDGFYFVSPQQLIAGEELDVFLILPEKNSGMEAAISCQVRVVRVESIENGLGFGIGCQIERYTVAASERTSLWRNYA
jgi:hypothetical protein